LNIHRFKVLARFGLMHVMATNICVWIRTLVLESLKEVTVYYLVRKDIPENNRIAEDLRLDVLKFAGYALNVETKPTSTASPGKNVNKLFKFLNF
jgi:hypothetical protein